MGPKRKTKELAEYISYNKLHNFDNGAWPVTTTEDFHTHDTILAPGPTLQQCSGADVMLAKGATMKPNLTKGKGRFLIVLPGILSIKPQGRNESKPDQDDISPIEATQDTDLSSHPLTQTTSDATIAALDDSVPPISSVTNQVTVPPKHLFGTISGLSTDSPKLTIPLPNKKQLLFVGRKMDSSSRFMMFQCHPRKATVTCKDSVQSIIVFGDGSIEDSSVMTIVEGTASSNSMFRHLGGSLRAFDGGKPGSLNHSQLRVIARPLVASSDGDGDDNIDDNDDKSVEFPPTAVDEDDSDEYVEIIKSRLEPKKRARRSTSEVKVSYTQDSGDEEISEATKEVSSPHRPTKRARVLAVKRTSIQSHKIQKGIPKIEALGKAHTKENHDAKIYQLNKSSLEEMESNRYNCEKPTSSIYLQHAVGARVADAKKKKEQHFENNDSSVEVASESDGADYVEVIKTHLEPKKRPRRTTLGTKISYTQNSEDESEKDNYEDQPRKGVISLEKTKTKQVNTQRSSRKRNEAHTECENDEDNAEEARTTKRVVQQVNTQRSSRKRKETTTVCENDKDNIEEARATKRAPRKKAVIKNAVQKLPVQSPNPKMEKEVKNPSKTFPARRIRGVKKQIVVHLEGENESNLETKKARNPSNGSKDDPIAIFNDVDEASPFTPVSTKKLGSPSPRTKSARRRMFKSLEDAVEDVADGGEWKIDHV